MIHSLATWLAGHLRHAERGQDLTEYAVLIALIAILAIAVVSLLGANLGLLLGAIATEVGP